MGATQAAVVDEGPAAPAAAVIGSGPQTTGLYTAQDAQGNSAAAQGLNYQWLLQGASYAQYELAAAGGGAVVLYSMYLNTMIEHPGNVSGPAIPVPANFVPLLATPAKTGVHGVAANWTYEFAAVDPPQTAHGAKVEVIGGSGAPTYGKPLLARPRHRGRRAYSCGRELVVTRVRMAAQGDRQGREREALALPDLPAAGSPWHRRLVTGRPGREPLFRRPGGPEPLTPSTSRVSAACAAYRSSRRAARAMVDQRSSRGSAVIRSRSRVICSRSARSK